MEGEIKYLRNSAGKELVLVTRAPHGTQVLLTAYKSLTLLCKAISYCSTLPDGVEIFGCRGAKTNMTEITRWTIVERWHPNEREQYRFYEQPATAKRFETSEEAKEYKEHLKAMHPGGELRVVPERDVEAAVSRRRLRGRNPSGGTRGSNRGPRR